MKRTFLRLARSDRMLFALVILVTLGIAVAALKWWNHLYIS